MAVSPLLHQSHEVLNADFCSGYIDQFGKWNTGFPCPWLDVSTPGFCCGTDNYKYCCSGKQRIATAPPPLPEDPLLLVLAITLGVAAGITLLILVACFVCPGCLLHKKRRPGPLYRLPCSSTMSTYVPTAVTTSSPGLSNQQHRPTTMGFNDVRASSSFQSFNSGVADGLIGSGVVNGVSTLYSLADTHYPTVAMSDSNGPGSTSHEHGQEMNRSCHHLYWSRPGVRMPSTVNGHSIARESQQHSLPSRIANTPQGHVSSNYGHQGDPSPPPPYEADYNHVHRQHQQVTVINNRAQLRHHLERLQQQHQAETNVFRQQQQQQQQQSSNISPRQPALCIIDDGRRDNPQLTYHSTKF